MPFYRKKPVVIEAVQYKKSLENNTLTSIGTGPVQQFLRQHGHAGYGLKREGTVYVPFIRTLEGDMLIKEGDWIIRGVKGEFYPCKADIFEATYDPL